MSEKNPSPGSDEALALGCTCPVSDNYHGEGRGDGLFYISGDCPLHANKPNANAMYPITEETQAQLDTQFTYHAPIPGQQERYVLIRDTAKHLAETIVANTPKSREQSVALTQLETAIFWANAAIARNEKPSA